jgi:hypothetical protein
MKSEAPNKSVHAQRMAAMGLQSHDEVECFGPSLDVTPGIRRDLFRSNFWVGRMNRQPRGELRGIEPLKLESALVRVGQVEPRVFVSLVDEHSVDLSNLARHVLAQEFWPPVPKTKQDVSWHRELIELEAEIDKAANGLEARDAVQRLESMLERIEDTSAHAVARVRRLARKLPKLQLAEEPAWLPALLNELTTRDAPNARHEPTLRTAVMLIRHFLAVADSPTLSASSISISATHAVEVEWREGLSWLIYPAELSWPAVHVRVYGNHDGESGGARSFWYANSVAEHSAQLLDR